MQYKFRALPEKSFDILLTFDMQLVVKQNLLHNKK
jgi:hypothetical protein